MIFFFSYFFSFFFARKRVRRRPLERWVFMSDHKITGNKSQQHGIRLSAPPSQKKRRINKQSLLRAYRRADEDDGDTEHSLRRKKYRQQHTQREKNRRASQRWRPIDEAAKLGESTYTHTDIHRRICWSPFFLNCAIQSPLPRLAIYIYNIACAAGLLDCWTDWRITCVQPSIYLYMREVQLGAKEKKTTSTLPPKKISITKWHQ